MIHFVKQHHIIFLQNTVLNLAISRLIIVWMIFYAGATMQKWRVFVTSVVMTMACNVVFAQCSADAVIQDVHMYFFKHYLGIYRIDLSSTLSAVADGNDHSGYPYYEKTWMGKCPHGLRGACIEFTVYPNNTNFSPAGIMRKIKKYTHDGQPNRGEVRVITNSAQSRYVYTTNHERTFCGPYPVPTDAV